MSSQPLDTSLAAMAPGAAACSGFCLRLSRAKIEVRIMASYTRVVVAGSSGQVDDTCKGNANGRAPAAE